MSDSLRPYGLDVAARLLCPWDSPGRRWRKLGKTVGFPGGSAVKNPSAIQETRVPSPGQENPLEKDMVTHSVFLPGKSHGQRSLVGYSPWGRKESDRT